MISGTARYLSEGALERDFPKFLSQAGNRSLREVTTGFTRLMVTTLFREGVYRVRRTGSPSPRPRNRPKPVKKAVIAGWAAAQTAGRDEAKFSRKGLVIRTSSPILVAREYRRTIRPKKGDFLFFPPKKTRGRRRKAAKLQLVKVRKVDPVPGLGARRAWVRYGVAARRIHEANVDRAIVRANRAIEARARRRAAAGGGA